MLLTPAIILVQTYPAFTKLMKRVMRRLEINKKKRKIKDTHAASQKEMEEAQEAERNVEQALERLKQAEIQEADEDTIKQLEGEVATARAKAATELAEASKAQDAYATDDSSDEEIEEDRWERKAQSANKKTNCFVRFLRSVAKCCCPRNHRSLHADTISAAVVMQQHVVNNLKILLMSLSFGLVVPLLMIIVPLKIYLQVCSHALPH